MGHLEIVEPCGEDWSAMTPAEGGRFCGRCRETVVDLTRARRADAERRVRGGAARCAQLAVDEHGRAVFAAEPSSRVAKLALRLAVVGAVASGCAPGEDATVDGVEDAAPQDGSPDGSSDVATEPLAIGSGSLLTGRGRDIPLAEPRPPIAPAVPAIATPAASRTTPNAPPAATLAPPEDGIAPRVHHLRGRVAYRP